MKIQFLRTTFFGGMIFLIPAVALMVVTRKALSLLHKLVVPIAVRLPFESVSGLKTPLLLAILMPVVSEGRILPANVPITSVIESLKGYGVGATALLASFPPPKTPPSRRPEQETAFTNEPLSRP